MAAQASEYVGVSGTATERGRACLHALEEAGRRGGWETRREYPVPGGRVDLVWLWRPDPALPGVAAPLPVAGFEIESSSRTRKHVKGDLVNLVGLQASLGVIVLLGLEGDGGLVRHTELLVKEWRTRIAVWTERDVEALMEGKAPPTSTTSPSEALAEMPERPTDTHWGKYQPLWAWLLSRPDDRVELTFTEIEEILGFPLPPSSRKHPPHWHSYKGSAVVRAIRDAGWRARDVSIRSETVVLERVT